MWRLILLLSVLQTARCSCPTGFELVRDGQCRGKYVSLSSYTDTAGNSAISKCKEIGGLPIIIHNEEVESYWMNWREANGSRPYYKFPIGLTCNTEIWEWADGTQVDFKPRFYDGTLTSSCTPNFVCSWLMNGGNGEWQKFCEGDSTKFTPDIFCTTQLSQPTGDGCQSFQDDSEDGICYQVSSTMQTWQDAQTTCRNLGSNVASIHSSQENSFVRRVAVSNGATNGVYLGATVSGKGNKFGWTDGSDWDYDNFHPGFPTDKLGDCLAMDTLSTAGEWMNMDCSSKLAVACARPSDPRHTCSSGPWKEGEVVLLLEANTCCDYLILTDNVLGGNIVANLTGEISDKIYTTKSSNFMRVSWVPNGGVNVRGMMMTYRGV